MPPSPEFASTPQPPYYAVIFTSLRGAAHAGYGAMAERMVELAALQPGFLGVESTRSADGFGITVSNWSSMDAIMAWKANLEHQDAQEQGRQRWYEHYEVRIACVERAHAMEEPARLASDARGAVDVRAPCPSSFPSQRASSPVTREPPARCVDASAERESCTGVRGDCGL